MATCETWAGIYLKSKYFCFIANSEICFYFSEKKNTSDELVNRAMHPKKTSPFVFPSVKELSLPGVITWTLLGFVWLSIRLQQDLMTFIIRWWNLIWAAPLSEMSSKIWSYAGENKRGSNYSLGAQVRWAQFAGDESTAGRDTDRRNWWGKERHAGWVMKEINSELPPSGYETPSEDLFPHRAQSNGPLYYPWGF